MHVSPPPLPMPGHSQTGSHDLESMGVHLDVVGLGHRWKLDHPSRFRLLVRSLGIVWHNLRPEDPDQQLRLLLSAMRTPSHPLMADELTQIGSVK